MRMRAALLLNLGLGCLGLGCQGPHVPQPTRSSSGPVETPGEPAPEPEAADPAAEPLPQSPCRVTQTRCEKQGIADYLDRRRRDDDAQPTEPLDPFGEHFADCDPEGAVAFDPSAQPAVPRNGAAPPAVSRDELRRLVDSTDLFDTDPAQPSFERPRYVAQHDYWLTHNWLYDRFGSFRIGVLYYQLDRHGRTRRVVFDEAAGRDPHEPLAEGPHPPHTTRQDYQYNYCDPPSP